MSVYICRIFMQIKKILQRFVNWEQWPFFVLYAPISAVWLWNIIRSRAVWFFTPSNPYLSFGGFEGEGKKEMYDLLPPQLVPVTVYISKRLSFSELLRRVKLAGLQYPFVVKPDVGMKGILFRIIESEQQLKQYHERMPVRYIVQEKIDYPLEVSVFYYRYPWEEKGVISGFIHKELLHVQGDGKSNLKELVGNHPRARYRLEEMERRHGQSFQKVIPAGELYYLSFAGNHNRGARFTNMQEEVDEKMLSVFDQLSHRTCFYYGRYDIKAASIEDLKQGKQFSILEYNGAGAEPNHIYDCGMSLLQAYGIILHHWKALYRISRYNAKHGFPYWSYRRGLKYLRAARRHFSMLEKLD